MSDLISRKAAIEAIEELENRYFVRKAVLVMAQDAINNLPSAQPETPPYVSEIESEYKKWVNIPYINKPLAKALYEVWKKHDEEDVSRNG